MTAQLNGQKAAPVSGAVSAPFAPPPARPTQTGPLGLRYDFNYGARLLLPPGLWQVKITDDSDNLLYGCETGGGWVLGSKKYYLPFRLTVHEAGQLVLDHSLDLEGREVLVHFPPKVGLGDALAWIGYVEKFQQKHQCRLECVLRPDLVKLLVPQYPDLLLSAPGEVRTKEPYATYRLGLFFDDSQGDQQPLDFRQVGLSRTAAYILDLDPAEIRPRLHLKAPRTIVEPYVCIAMQSTSQAKFWNNGGGWPGVIEYLQDLGYRVFCLDRDRNVGSGYVWNRIPQGVEDFTGDRPLQERVDILRHADFFVGLSSGLSWLAWGAGIPVVLISGFTRPTCEFYTPYRVFNRFGCSGCWDDQVLRFDPEDFLWCPRHQGTARQFECSRLITAQQVIGHIQRLMADGGLVPPRVLKASS